MPGGPQFETHKEKDDEPESKVIGNLSEKLGNLFNRKDVDLILASSVEVRIRLGRIINVHLGRMEDVEGRAEKRKISAELAKVLKDDIRANLAGDIHSQAEALRRNP